MPVSLSLPIWGPGWCSEESQTVNKIKNGIKEESLLPAIPHKLSSVGKNTGPLTDLWKCLICVSYNSDKKGTSGFCKGVERDTEVCDNNSHVSSLMSGSGLWARQLYSPITWNHTQEPCFWEVTFGEREGQSDSQLARFVKAAHVQKSCMIPEKKVLVVCVLYIYIYNMTEHVLNPLCFPPLKSRRKFTTQR